MSIGAIHNYSMDTEEGIDFLRKLADLTDDPELHFELAVTLHDRFDESCYPEIVEHLIIASDKGHADATNLLGHCYLTGIGVGKNPKKAVELYIRSAEMGSSDGCFSAGNELLMGKNIESDYDKAYDYLTKSAKCSNDGAINAIAIMHLYGYHVPRDIAKAKALFKKSMQMGNIEAKHNLEHLCDQGEDYDPTGTPIRFQYHDLQEVKE